MSGCRHPDGCNRPHRAGGWCQLHGNRIYRTGDPGPVGKIYGTDDIGYWSCHDRVEAARGKAADQRCTFDDAHAAEQWALRADAGKARLDRTVGANGLWCSPDPDDYIALCKSCHERYDAWLRLERRAWSDLRHPSTRCPVELLERVAAGELRPTEALELLLGGAT